MTIKTDTKLLAEECVKLNKIIKENEEKIETLKEELQKKMLEEKIDVIEGDGYKVRHTSYNNKYSSVLAEDFSNLSTEIINNLIKEDLVMASYRLNTEAYLKKIREQGDSPVTPFVKERKTKSFIAIRNI